MLLGCSYFDLSHCGYFESKDVEDILLTLELDLSRAELKKVASKLAVKDSINYRALTDGEVNEEEAENEVNEMKKDPFELSKGFKQFVPGMKDAIIVIIFTVLTTQVRGLLKKPPGRKIMEWSLTRDQSLMLLSFRRTSTRVKK